MCICVCLCACVCGFYEGVMSHTYENESRHRVASEGHIAVVKILLDEGAEVCVCVYIGVCM